MKQDEVAFSMWFWSADFFTLTVLSRDPAYNLILRQCNQPEQFDKNLSNSIKERLNFYNKIFLSRSMLMIFPGIITVINPLKNVMINKTFKF